MSMTTNTNTDTNTIRTKVYLVTGANSGLGLDTVRKLSTFPETKTIYVSCRTEAKAEAAIQQIKQVNGNIASAAAVNLVYIKFDAVNDSASIAQIVMNTMKEPLDGLVLNAGGFGNDKVGKPAGPNNIVPMHQINVVATLQFVESLKDLHLLKRGCRIVYAGSEAARGIPTFFVGNPKMGSQAAWYQDELEGKHSYDPMQTYAVAKGMAALYFAAWARRNPEYVALVVSPGATVGTEVLATDAVPGLFKAMVLIMGSVMTRIGTMHHLTDGSDRYIRAVLGQGDMTDFPSGTFVASAHGTTGKVSDQSKSRRGKKYGDQDKQEVVYRVLRRYLNYGGVAQRPEQPLLSQKFMADTAFEVFA